MGRRYTFYRYVGRSSREYLNERQPIQRYWISCLVVLKSVVESAPQILMTERRVITFPAESNHRRLSVSPTKHLSLPREALPPLPSLGSRRRTLLQPGVSSTLRRTRREVVASCESNLGYPKTLIWRRRQDDMGPKSRTQCCTAVRSEIEEICCQTSS